MWPKVETVRTDLSQRKTLVRLVNAADIVCGALPGSLGFDLLQEAVQQGRDIVDISYTPKGPFHPSPISSRQ